MCDEISEFFECKIQEFLGENCMFKYMQFKQYDECLWLFLDIEVIPFLQHPAILHDKLIEDLSINGYNILDQKP